MSMLTEEQYEEYIRLLRAWVDMEKALEGPEPADAEMTKRAREARAAVASFRAAHGLTEAAVETAAPVYARPQRRQAEA